MGSLLVDDLVLKLREPAVLTLIRTEVGNAFKLVDDQEGIPEMELVSIVQKRTGW